MRHHASKQAIVILLAMLISQPTSFLAAASSTRGLKDEVSKYSIPKDKELYLTQAQTIQLIQQKIKYVFVLYQENRSFDSYFGTFPGAAGLYSQSAASTPGFTQQIVNTDGTTSTIHPFRIGPNEKSCGTVTKCYAADTDDIDHSHPRIVAKMDVVNGVPLMDKFALIEEQKYVSFR